MRKKREFSKITALEKSVVFGHHIFLRSFKIKI
jgi:hypothetical protein